jgi:hypothetical protein
MLPELDQRLLKMEQSLNEMISLLDGLEPATLHRKPNGKWSPAQVFQHLHDSEKGTLSYLMKKLSSPESEVPKGGLGSMIRSKLLKRALRNKKKKYRAPKVLGEMASEPDYPMLRSEYLEIRKNLRSLLSNVDRSKINRAYFKHPVAGRLTIPQMLGFLEDHFSRHYEQIKERIR